jgi:propanol-preferring alcohol dehydrogenase
MRAMVLRRPAPVDRRPLALEDRPDPQPGPGALRVRVLACGVCRTDLHVVEGELPPHREELVPGHQVVGVVDRVGPGVDPSWVGRRVGIAWLHEACGRCRYCQTGRENLCPAARFTGWDVDGGYAEAAVVPAAFAYPLPDGLDPVGAAPLLCAGIIGYWSLRLAGVEPGMRVGLFGFGASAHLALQVARHWGCEVYAFSRRRSHQELALALGARWAGPPDAEPPEALDAAVSFAPVGAVVPLALRRLAPGGTLAINAVHLDRIPELDYGWLYGERTLRSVTNATREDGAAFLRLAAEVPLRARAEAVPLAEANEALQRLARSEVDGALVLVP